MFYKLKREGNWYRINNDLGKKTFIARSSFSPKEIEEVFTFAYDMSFGERGRHRQTRTGGMQGRKNGQIFTNVFQGKLAECAIYKELRIIAEESGAFSADSISAPDFSEFDLGIWDHVDININGRTASVKSTKHYGQLLLLETGDWDNEGRYLHSMNNGVVEPVAYDFIFLVRISPSCEDVLKKNRLLYSDEADESNLRNMLNLSWSYDIPGFITLHDLKYIINEGYILPQNAEYGSARVSMDAENYYVRAADMHDISEISNYIR